MALALTGLALWFEATGTTGLILRLLPPLDPREVPSLLTFAKLMRADNDASYCRAALARSSARFTVMGDLVKDRRCHVRNRVRLTRLSRADLAPLETRCATALRLYMWERHDLQPLAARHYDSAVTRIDHFGSYSCRTIAGTRTMSHHATASAVDVAGFRTASGRHVTLRRHWDAAADRRFLRAAGRAACDRFATVLGPDYNAAHADHFHFNLGLAGTCR